MNLQGFERFVAWRYLTDGGRRQRWGTLVVGLVLAAIGVAIALLSKKIPLPPEHSIFVAGDRFLEEPWRLWVAEHVGLLRLVGGGVLALAWLAALGATRFKASKGVIAFGLIVLALVLPLFVAAELEPRVPMGVNWKRAFQFTGAGFVVGGALVAFFGVLMLFFSIFTTISTYGVFLGTGALVIVLSVMNGFAVDLRKKILGSNAHVLITKVDGRFEDYARVAKVAEGVKGVKAVSPFVSTEIVVSSPSSYQGVNLKGIDEASVDRVSDLAKNLVEPEGVPARTVIDSMRPPKGWEQGGPLLPDPEEEEFDPGAEETPAEPEPAPPSAPLPDKSGDAGKLPDPEDDPGLKLPEIVDPYDDPEVDEDLLYADDPVGKPVRIPAMVAPPAEETLPGVIIGKELAKNLGNVHVGEELTIVSTIPSLAIDRATPNSRPVRIAGIFFSGMYEYDTKNVYVTLAVAQQFLRMADDGVAPAVTGVEVMTGDIENTGGVVKALEAALGPGYRVQDWKSLNRNLFTALKLEKVAMFIVLTIIILVASFSIISNLIMVVVEKAREIAILKSMGASDSSVLRVFMYEGLYIGVVGMAGGLTFGVAGCFALKVFGLPLDPEVYYIDRLPVAMEPWAVAAVAGAAVAISFLATLYPSWVAARLRPIEGLRWE